MTKSVIWIDNTCLILTITMFFWCLTKSLAELLADQKLFPQASTYQRRWPRCSTDCCPRPRQEGGCWECLVVDLLLSTHPLLLSCILYFPSHLLLKKGNGEKSGEETSRVNERETSDKGATEAEEIVDDGDLSSSVAIPGLATKSIFVLFAFCIGICLWRANQ